MSINSAFFVQIKSALVPLLKNVIAKVPENIASVSERIVLPQTPPTPTFLVSEETDDGEGGTVKTLKRYSKAAMQAALEVSGGTDHDFVVTAELDPNTMTISNVSATLGEIAAAKEENKDVRLDAVYNAEGEATLIFSAPLTNCHSVTYDGTVYYSVIFTTTFADDEEISFINITADGTENDDDFNVQTTTEPLRLIINVAVNNNFAITGVNGIDLEKLQSITNQQYFDRLIVCMVKADGTAVPLTLTYADSTTIRMRFAGEDQGIRYSLAAQVYPTAEQVPSGAYSVACEYEGDILYAGLTLDMSLAGMEHIDIAGSSDLSTGALTISNVTLPELFEQKYQIVRARNQGANISVNIIDSSTGGIYVLHPKVVGPTGIIFKGELPNNYNPAAVINCNLAFYSTQPQSGYSIALPSGGYLAVYISMHTQPT